MKCERVIQSFLKQDDCRYPSILIRLHITFCSACREEIRNLQKIFVSVHKASPFAMPEDLSDEIMRRIFKSGPMFENNISSSKWFYTGVILFASIILVSYSDSFIWLREHFGRELEIPLNIVLGLAITSYAASYIGTHIEGVKKFAEFISHKIN